MLPGMHFALAHAVLLLAVSYFVLLTLNKAGSNGIRNFGWAVAVLLWISAVTVVVGGVQKRHPFNPAMRGDRWEQRQDRMNDMRGRMGEGRAMDGRGPRGDRMNRRDGAGRQDPGTAPERE